MICCKMIHIYYNYFYYIKNNKNKHNTKQVYIENQDVDDCTEKYTRVNKMHLQLHWRNYFSR